MLQKHQSTKLSSRNSGNKLTIIIPFLNEGEEVENTLKSIRKTAYDLIDILIINDASTDGVNYRLIAQKYNTKYVKNKKRLGVAASRDKGVSLISTPYFLLLDAHMRFYQDDWVKLIVDELDKNDRVLLCCNTKVLQKTSNGKLEESDSTPTFGATINFEGDKWMLDAKWSSTEKKLESNIENIACVLGAGYAASKRYWQYLRGLEGLIHYGSDETYISLKVWLEGGQCRLLKNIKIGHIYRTQAPYEVKNTEIIFNKLWIAELLLPFSYKLRTFGALYEENPKVFREAFALLSRKKQQCSKLKAYYQDILTHDFQRIIKMNVHQHTENDVQKKLKLEKLGHSFKQLLLNCNTLPSDGLWYGRMGCILFLAKFDQSYNNNLYEDLIEELINEMYSRIANNNLNIDLGCGLCGIAYGLTWLVDHQLMEGDLSEVLFEVDRQIMERSPLRINDYSLKNGLAGILYYILYRIQIAQQKHLPLPFDAKYINDLNKAASKALKGNKITACYEMASWLTTFIKNPTLKLEIPDIIQILNLNTITESNHYPLALGLKEGLAGIGLSKISE